MKMSILNRYVGAALTVLPKTLARPMQTKPCALALGPDDHCEFGPYGDDGESVCRHCGAEEKPKGEPK